MSGGLFVAGRGRARKGCAGRAGAVGGSAPALFVSCGGCAATGAVVRRRAERAPIAERSEQEPAEAQRTPATHELGTVGVVAERYDTVTFLSDFGLRDEFVGVVKSVIREIARHVTVIDLTHEPGVRNQL